MKRPGCIPAEGIPDGTVFIEIDNQNYEDMQSAKTVCLWNGNKFPWGYIFHADRPKLTPDPDDKDPGRCPFCGSEEVTVYHPSPASDAWFVSCMDCGASSGHKSTRELAVKSWNQRPL